MQSHIKNPIRSHRVPKNVLKELSPHPRVIKMLEWHKDVPEQANFALVLEFCNSGTVFDLFEHAKLAGQKVPQDFVCHTFCQLVEGLLYCRRKGYGHRDVKPAKWFLKFNTTKIHDYPDIILGDFGSTTITALSTAGIFDFLQSSIKDYEDSDGAYNATFSGWIRQWQQKRSSKKRPVKEDEPGVDDYKWMDKMIRAGLDLLKGTEHKKNRIPPWMSSYLSTRLDGG